MCVCVCVYPTLAGRCGRTAAWRGPAANPNKHAAAHVSFTWNSPSWLWPLTGAVPRSLLAGCPQPNTASGPEGQKVHCARERRGGVEAEWARLARRVMCSSLRSDRCVLTDSLTRPHSPQTCAVVPSPRFALPRHVACLLIMRESIHGKFRLR